MGRPYSDDLRERVLLEAERTSGRAAGARFGISPATATRWTARARGGERTARSLYGPRGSRLDGHAEFVEGMIEQQPDITLNEMVERLATGRNVRIGRSALSDWLRARAWTFKKRPHTHWSRTGQTS